MAIACVDTHILIWGIQREATPGQEEMIPRAQALLAQLERDRTQVVVPSVVIGEFLIGLPASEQPRYQDIISRRFVVVPYDLRASIHFARIWQQKRDANVFEELKARGATRTLLRADTMIVATALAASATSLYGHDEHIERLAKGLIAYHDILSIALQTNFLDNPPGT
jgi:predicted nucleic acid-binding protein